MAQTRLRCSSEVDRARREGLPIVALESTIIAHGLPRPRNRSVAEQVEARVREHGAIPATIGMIGGELIVGLSADEIAHLATAEQVAKLSVRDLAVAATARIDGATTVASTAAIAALAGIAVFATGGLGGVHRDAGGRSYDESADLVTLASTPILVVCAGVKSILDVAATLERLETFGVTVVGYRSRRFAGFYLSDSGHELDWAMESPSELAAVLVEARRAGVHRGAIVVSNPLPPAQQLDPAMHARALAEGLAGLARDGVTGRAVTPYLLAHFHEATSGESLEANIRIICANAELAAQIAVAFAGSSAPA